MNGPVLVAADFNDQTAHLLHTARELATRLSLPMIVVHVVEPIEDPAIADPDTRNFHDELIRRAQGKLQELTGGWSNVTSLVQLGHRADEILRLCEAHCPSMLVMGASAQRTTQVGIGLQLFLRCQCPILSVPAEARDRHTVSF